MQMETLDSPYTSEAHTASRGAGSGSSNASTGDGSKVSGSKSIGKGIHHGFQRIINQLESETLDVLEQFTFHYKHHVQHGNALHVAALHPEGAFVFEALIDLKADVHSLCHSTTKVGTFKSKAIHLAAGVGNVSMLLKLLAAGCCVEEAASLDDEYHFRPLHEASYLGQLHTVTALLQSNARVNSSNFFGMTPLHLAALQGHADVAKILLAHHADIEAKNHAGCLPVVVAVKQDRFPHRHLHLITPRRMDALLLVADLSPDAALHLSHQWHDGVRKFAGCESDDEELNNVEVMKRCKTPEFMGRVSNVVFAPSDSFVRRVSNVAGDMGPEVSVSVRDDRIRGVDVGGWIKLVELAPEAAEELLDAVTVMPRVVDNLHHPLPRRAAINGDMNCYYGPEIAWDFDLQARPYCYPSWHNAFAPETALTGIRKVFVDVHRVDLPCIVSPHVLHVLVETRKERIFSKLVTQAILQYLWQTLVCKTYALTLVYDCLWLLALMAAVLKQDELVSKMTWSCNLVMSTLALVTLLSEFVARVCQIGFGCYQHVMRRRMWVELCTTCMAISLSYRSIDDFGMRKNPWQMGAVCFYAWCHLVDQLRAFPVFGERLLAIVASFMSMAPILIITGCAFFGFLHAGLALSSESADEVADVASTLLAIFRLLLMSDGDGADTVLTLGGTGSTGDIATVALMFLAVFGFCICVLNVFIAVHGEAYDLAQERGRCFFFRERARICLKSLLLPHWSRCGLHRPNQTVIAIQAVSWGLWFGFLCGSKLHPLVASGELLLGLLVSQYILLQRPWEKRRCHDTSSEGENMYLWICCRADWQEMQYWPDEAEGTMLHHRGASPGRMESLKREQHRQFNVVKSLMVSGQMESERRLMKLDKLDEIEQTINSVADRVKALEKRVDPVARASSTFSIGAETDRLSAGSNLLSNSPCSRAKHGDLSFVQSSRVGHTLSLRSGMTSDRSTTPRSLGNPSDFKMTDPDAMFHQASFARNSGASVASSVMVRRREPESGISFDPDPQFIVKDVAEADESKLQQRIKL